MGSRGAIYVSGTAEDQPPSPGAWLGSSRTNRFQYNEEWGPTQLLKQRRGSPVAWFLAVAAGSLTLTPCSGKNSSRNGLAEAITPEGCTSPESYGAGNGRRPNRRSPDTGSAVKNTAVQALLHPQPRARSEQTGGLRRLYLRSTTARQRIVRPHRTCKSCFRRAKVRRGQK